MLITKIDEKLIQDLNSVEKLPKDGLKRNSAYYWLVANTNCLLGLILSNNSRLVSILFSREKQYIDLLKESHDHPYLQLCERFLNEIESKYSEWFQAASKVINPQVLSRMAKMEELQRNPNIDCNDIASVLKGEAGGGKTINFEMGAGKTLRVPKSGKIVDDQAYHNVFSDGKFVHGPRYSAQAVPQPEYLSTMQKLNPGVRVTFSVLVTVETGIDDRLIQKLNRSESLPEHGLRRNSIYYDLVANTNCLLGAVLSANLSTLGILVTREKQCLDELRQQNGHPHSTLCEESLEAGKARYPENTLGHTE